MTIEGLEGMGSDLLSTGLIWVSCVLGFVILVIVGSQAPEDARPIAAWTLGVLIPMFLLSCTSLAIPDDGGSPTVAGVW